MEVSPKFSEYFRKFFFLILGSYGEKCRKILKNEKEYLGRIWRNNFLKTFKTYA